MGAAGSVHGISTQTLVQNAADPAMRGPGAQPLGPDQPRLPGARRPGARHCLGEVFGLRLPTILAMLLALGVVAWGRGGCR